MSLSSWLQKPNHTEFEFSIKPYHVFIKSGPNGELESYREPVTTEVMGIRITITNEAMPDIPSKEILYKLMENMAYEFQMKLISIAGELK